MTSSMTNGVIFVAGMVAGAVCGWMVAKGVYEKLADEKIEEMANSYRERDKRRTERLHDLNEAFKAANKRIEDYEATEKSNDTDNEDVVDENIEAESSDEDLDTCDYYMSDKYYDLLTQQYTGHIEESRANMVEDDDEDYADEEDDMDGLPIGTPPYVITFEEYCNKQGYNYKPVTFYEGDKVLVDDWSEEIDDIDGAVGWNNIDEFLETDEDTVYIRNENEMLDYIVTRDPRSWCNIPVAKL